MNTCRCCGSSGLVEVLRLNNMPARAQYLLPVPSDESVDLAISQCAKCGVVQIPGEPVEYFRESLRSAGLSAEMRAFRVEQLSRWVREHDLVGKPVLEVGCGRGEYLEVLAEAGVDAVGVEKNQAAVEVCRRKGLNVYGSYLPEDPIATFSFPFSGFASFSFLEHCPWPPVLLNAVRSYMKRDAVGLIEVPNFDMMLRERMALEFMLDHLVYFTKGTLTAFLSTHGFDVLTVEPVWHDYILSATVRRRAPARLKEMEMGAMSLGVSWRIFVVGGERFAVWGAGHQSLATLALMRPFLPAYVVDSSPEKIGRYTPVTNLPIVAPERLGSDPVDALIVACAGYSDEVAAKAREINPAMRIAILRPEGLVTAS